MTLCIGALSQTVAPEPFSECIVLCFDLKVSAVDGEFSSETEYKLSSLNGNPVALISGRLGRAKELCGIYKSHLTNTVLTEDNLLDRMREPLGIIKHRLAEAYTQRCLAISYDDLLDRDENWIGKERRERYLAAIDQNKLGVDLIFAGFVDGKAIVCELRDGDVTRASNFSVIGSGSYTAEPALHARGQMATTSLEDTLYNVYEAKRYAETSPNVGPQTFIYVLYPPTTAGDKVAVKKITKDGYDYLRRKYRRLGPKPTGKWERLPDGSLESAYFNVK